jgi:hypothetical protein
VQQAYNINYNIKTKNIYIQIYYNMNYNTKTQQMTTQLQIYICMCFVFLDHIIMDWGFWCCVKKVGRVNNMFPCGHYLLKIIQCHLKKPKMNKDNIINIDVINIF